MLEGLYGVLNTFGFSHPLHPILVHVPMGMVIGAALFALVGLKWHNQHLDQTASHCALLALIFVVPTLIAGILDWQHFYNGTWQLLIVVKLVLGLLLTVLLAAAVVLNYRGVERKQLLIVYLLCLACAGGLGFSGGELVYG